MGRSGESSTQRAERLEAERISKETAVIAQREKDLQLKQSQEIAQKQKDLAKRSTGMAGGGREGLMYKGSNTGVQR